MMPTMWSAPMLVIGSFTGSPSSMAEGMPSRGSPAPMHNTLGLGADHLRDGSHDVLPAL